MPCASVGKPARKTRLNYDYPLRLVHYVPLLIVERQATVGRPGTFWVMKRRIRNMGWPELSLGWSITLLGVFFLVAVSVLTAGAKRRRRTTGGSSFSHHATAPTGLLAHEELDLADLEEGRVDGVFNFAREPEAEEAGGAAVGAHDGMRRRRVRPERPLGENASDEPLLNRLDDAELSEVLDGALGHVDDAADADAALRNAELQEVGGDGPDDIAAVAGPAAPPIRVDIPDGFILPGDISREAMELAAQRFLPLVLQDWATRHLVPQTAVTSLLQLFHGEFGRRLGVNPVNLAPGGGIPKTAQTISGYVDDVMSGLHIELLRLMRFAIPRDHNLRGKGAAHTVDLYFSPDLALNILYKLMDPNLTSSATPLMYEHDPSLPPGIYCGPTYYSAAERADRLAAIARAREELPAVVARVLPGVDPALVAIIAIGINAFLDSVNPQQNQATCIYAFLLGISNLHPAVARSPHGVVVAGLWNPPAVLRAKKIAGEDGSMNASPFTQANAAIVDATIQQHVIAGPLLKLFNREPLIVRASDLHLPNNFPVPVRCAWSMSAPSRYGPRAYLYYLALQYVALKFYGGHISGDAPVMAKKTGKTEHHCFVDGVHGADLSKVRRNRSIRARSRGGNP